MDAVRSVNANRLPALLDAKADGCTHVIFVRHNGSAVELPIRITPEEGVDEVLAACSKDANLTVLGVYDLFMDLDAQLDEDRPMHAYKL